MAAPTGFTVTLPKELKCEKCQALGRPGVLADVAYLMVVTGEPANKLTTDLQAPMVKPLGLCNRCDLDLDTLSIQFNRVRVTRLQPAQEKKGQA